MNGHLSVWVATVLCAACSVILSKKLGHIPAIYSVPLTGGIFWATSLVWLGVNAWTGNLPSTESVRASGTLPLTLALMIMLVGVLYYIANMLIIGAFNAHVSLRVVATISSTIPLFVTIMECVIDAKWPTTRQMAGLILLPFAVWLIIPSGVTSVRS